MGKLAKLAEKRREELTEGAKPSTEGGSTSSKSQAPRAISPRTNVLTKDLSKLILPTSFRIRYPEPNSVRRIEFIISPEDGMWKGGNFLFELSFPTDYPMVPPKVLCKTTIYHPNIDLDGHVCLNILRDTAWSSAMTIEQVVNGLSFLFYEPNASDPLNKDAAALMGGDINAFKRKIADTYRGGFFDGHTFERQPVRFQ